MAAVVAATAVVAMVMVVRVVAMVWAEPAAAVTAAAAMAKVAMVAVVTVTRDRSRNVRVCQLFRTNCFVQSGVEHSPSHRNSRWPRPTSRGPMCSMVRDRRRSGTRIGT